MKELAENKIFVFSPPIKISGKYYIKKILYPFLCLFYKIVLFFYHQPKGEKKYKIAICGIFRDEAPFIVEWIEYHRIIGVDHFYLYNNLSQDNYLEMLQPYIDLGIVTLIDWPIAQGQIAAYENWFSTYRSESKWVSFLDLDEFICLSYKKNVYDWVEKYNKYPCILVYWKMFGTSGKMKHDYDKSVIEQYIVSWDKLYATGKVLFNTNYDIAFFNNSTHHNTTAQIKIKGIKINIPPINEFRYFVKWGLHTTGKYNLCDSTIQVNHYWSKAYEIYTSKMKKGDVAFVDNPKTRDYFLWHENHNKNVDLKIFRFIQQLKEALLKRVNIFF